MARRNNQELAFPALSIEGGLLAPDFLNKVAHLEAAEQNEADYDVPRGLKLRDEIGRYWKIAQNLWQDFAAKRARTDLNNHALTVKELLEPLLRHVLCFGDLKAVGQVVLDERVFPIGFAAGEGRVPVVLAAYDQILDKPDARFGDGVRRRSPFLLAQEYLNANDGALWAIVGNGLKLRILRDNPSLTRPAYIEADLEAIFTEGLYPDFTALWLLAHASRFGKVGNEPSDCPLERWRNTAQEDGIRARDRLRVGVTEALRSLGTGFVAHPANSELRRRLEAGELSTQAYFEQLLRLIYRFIFLATIEDRDLLFAPEASADAKARYLAGYSLTRLRQLAARRRSYDRHADLWQALTIAFAGLGKGQPALGLPALGGLFATGQCPDLDPAQLDNSSLLSALFSLCFFRDGAALSRVNYRDMDSEELGSVYESLLELVPNLALTAGVRHFGFIGDDEEGSTKGNARKLTGSYYTPDSLVQELIKSALEPVIERTLADNPQEPVKALLGLSVCDPACGSGHFLLAAARRIAEEVARLNATDGNPLPADYRRALRDVVAHCVYGVDKNPMAVELARTALWLEAYTPERPLTFLDAHLRCGDALLGILDPAVLDAGIPDKAFNALSGDDKEVVKRIKKANRDALKAIGKAKVSSGQFCLGLEAEQDADVFEHLPDDTLDAVEAKRVAFTALQARLSGSRVRLAADLFVAAFVLPKTPDNESQVPTSQDLWLVQNGSAPRPGVADAARSAAEKAQVLHWWQAFPQVGVKGGFDVVLGNPPWERTAIEDEEFFAKRDSTIASTTITARRKQLIEFLRVENSLIWREYEFAKDKSAREALYFNESGCFKFGARGRLNTYALFADRCVHLVNDYGRCGMVLPSGILTDAPMEDFCRFIFGNGRVDKVVEFENSEAAFPAVHREQRFCLITLKGRALSSESAVRIFVNLTAPGQISDNRRGYLAEPSDFQLISPATSQPILAKSAEDYRIIKKIYANSVPFSNGVANAWVGMTSAAFSGYLVMAEELTKDEYTPVFEGKLIHQYDCAYATFAGVSVDDLRKGNPCLVPCENKDDLPVTRYFVKRGIADDFLTDKIGDSNWVLCYRDVTNVNNERTAIGTVLPRVAPMQPLNGISVIDAETACRVLGAFNSLIVDFVAKQRFSGRHLNVTTFSQLPFPKNDAFATDIGARVVKLLHTVPALDSFAHQLIGESSSNPLSELERAKLRAELDAYYARLYGLTRDELRYILDPADVMGEDYPSETFRVLKNNEMREFGEYRTQRLVLAAWDRFEAGAREPSVPVLSEQGLIRNADEADFAGIVAEVIRLLPEGISAGDLQTLVAYAMQPSMVAQLVDQPSAGRLITLMNSVCRIDVGTAIQLIPSILHRLQSTGVCRSIRRGEAVVYAGSTGTLPADVRCAQEHTELGGLLLALDAKRKAVARTGQEQAINTVERGAA